MFTFVTCLRHPDTARDYTKVTDLIGRTLASLNNQQSMNFGVILVANRRPQVAADLKYPLRIEQVDFPVPPAYTNTEQRRASVRLDKGAKLAVAVSLIESGHVMFLDFDDFVSRRVVGFAAEHPDHVGWFVRRGLRYDPSSGLYRRQANFDQVCGSSLIVHRSAMPFATLSEQPSREEVIARFGDEAVTHVFGSHRFMRDRFGLTPLPFAGAVYVVNTGQNNAPRSAISVGRPVTAAVSAEFGILPRPPLAVIRDMLRSAPRAGAQAVLRPYGSLRRKFGGRGASM